MYAFLADIHIGVKLPNVDFLDSLNKFFDLIKKNKESCECIFVCGDLFDHRLTIDEAKFASLFLSNLACNRCGLNGRTNVPVRIIHGTYSHDYNQMEIFLPLLKKIDNVDIEYYNKACEGVLPNGAKVLYLPQEYGDVDYSKAFNKQYDIVVGHGPIASEKFAPCPSANHDITLPVEKLSQISKICVFGHYHEYTNFGNGVFYTGSMLRFRYGEPTPKQFFFCDNNFKAWTEVNPYAMEFKVIDVYSPDELRHHLSEDIKTPHRFCIHTDNSDLDVYHAIMNTFKRNQNISYRVMTEKHTDENEPMCEATVYPSNVTYELPVPALISFIKERYNVDVADEIHDYENKILKEKKD